jgi:hypothetical protein
MSIYKPKKGLQNKTQTMATNESFFRAGRSQKSAYKLTFKPVTTTFTDPLV